MRTVPEPHKHLILHAVGRGPTVQDRAVVVNIAKMDGTRLHPNTIRAGTASVWTRRGVVIAALMLSLVFAERSPSQTEVEDPTTATEATTTDVDLEGVNARIKEVENTQDIDPASRECH